MDVAGDLGDRAADGGGSLMSPAAIDALRLFDGRTLQCYCEEQRDVDPGPDVYPGIDAALLELERAGGIMLERI